MSDTRRGDRHDREEHGEERELWVLSRRVPSRRRSDDVTVVGGAVLTVIGAIGFGISVVVDAAAELQLAALALSLLAFLVTLRRFFAATYPQVEAAQPRPDPDEDRAEVAEIGPVDRRGLLTRLLWGAAAALGLGALAPIVALGPRYRPPTTGWGPGIRLITERGEYLRPDEIPLGGIAVVWPEGALRREHASVILVRLTGSAREPTRTDWVVDDRIVAYSKVCTHAGCPVGLFRETDNTLFCPCHQSSFDASQGARPTFGPVSRPLPQLPLDVDADGYLIATGDLAGPVGPPQG